MPKKIGISELLSAEYHASCSNLGLEYDKVHDLTEFAKRFTGQEEPSIKHDLQVSDNIVVNLEPQMQSIPEFGHIRMLYRGFTWYCRKEYIPLNGFKIKANYDIPPPVELLPPGTEGFYLEIAAYGKKIDTENFSDYVPFCRMVGFDDYTFSYRKINPKEKEYPVIIKIDRSPFKHRKIG